MPDNLRDRIAAVQREHRLNSFGANYVQCECGWKSPEKYATWTDHPEHVADAVIAALGPIPDREFIDQWGHRWEWCGGVTGTWAWRITRLEQR